MDFLLASVIGVLVGVLLRMVVPGRTDGSWAVDLIMSILGAVVGVYLLHTVGMGHIIDFYTLWVIAIAGGNATMFLLITHTFFNRQAQ